MSFKCPTCDRPIYNRRRKWCEFCNGPIPESYLLSQTQMAAIDRLKADEAKQHKEFMSRPNSLPGAAALGDDIGDILI
jgi:hypothetical protein